MRIYLWWQNELRSPLPRHLSYRATTSLSASALELQSILTTIIRSTNYSSMPTLLCIEQKGKAAAPSTFMKPLAPIRPISYRNVHRAMDVDGINTRDGFCIL